MLYINIFLMYLYFTHVHFYLISLIIFTVQYISEGNSVKC